VEILIFFLEKIYAKINSLCLSPLPPLGPDIDRCVTVPRRKCRPQPGRAVRASSKKKILPTVFENTPLGFTINASQHDTPLHSFSRSLLSPPSCYGGVNMKWKGLNQDLMFTLCISD